MGSLKGVLNEINEEQSQGQISIGLNFVINNSET